MKRLLACLLLAVAAAAPAAAQKITIQHVEPPNWWVGLQDVRLLVLVYGEGIGATVPEFEHPGVQLVQYHQAWSSPNYLFLDLTVAPDAEAGTFTVTFREGRKKRATMDYTLLERVDRSGPGNGHDGFGNADAICLVTPDRFANGDPSNDVLPGLREQGVDRSRPLARHGGDLRGMIGMLDYLREMGFTALWPSPVLTNDMPVYSYHGYAITDFYGVDPRFGTLEDYRALADGLHARGMKLIQDQVLNHCGSGHWWTADPPFPDWYHHQDGWKPTNHQHMTVIDPYATRADRDGFVQGWFVGSMPDLNQRHPFMARYLIQHSIWWIETLGLDGIRQDTWSYAYEDFLDQWSCAIMRQYPDFSIVGEEWVDNPLQIAYYQRGFGDGEGCLDHVMDFYQRNRLAEALTEPERWDQGWVKLYQGMAYDVLYPDPTKLLVFADNHDMDRVMTAMGEDPALVKMALAWVLTTRGIPQLYYGTEVGLSNEGSPGDHGRIREDFPGGWAGDPVNAVTGEGLSAEQADLQAWVRRVLTWRRDREVLHTGKLKHWSPRDGLYVTGRLGGGEATLVLFNKAEAPAAPDWARFDDVLKGRREAVDVITGQRVTLDSARAVPPRSVLLLDLDPLGEP